MASLAAAVAVQQLMCSTSLPPEAYGIISFGLFQKFRKKKAKERQLAMT